MPRYLIRHVHDAADCDVSFAAWRRFESPLRASTVMCSCAAGDHEVHFLVAAPTPDAALGQVPPWLRTRATVSAVRDVTLP